MITLQTKIVGICIALAALFAFGCHLRNNIIEETKAPYEKLLAEQRAKVIELTNKEAKIKTEVVTVYKDRIKTVTVYKDKIINQTQEALKNETKDCVIGPNFIRLHNDAASGETIP